MKRLVIMTVGMTHSGKTTFAKALESRLGNAVVVDQDNHGEFLHTHYDKLVPKDGSNRIKHALTKTIVDYAVNHSDCHLILCNANRNQASRKELLSYYKKHDFTSVLVHFALPISILKERIAKNNRDTLRLRTASSYDEVLNRQHQQTGMEALDPIAGEADYLFTVKEEEDVSAIMETIIKLKGVNNGEE
ncbi:ATP-binding protein [Niallia sp.]|uniref:ATP-binding protein n=1 Tax=Niallia sp. TaxID=2837523 RepID=UPI00289E9B0A|nr:ATP-binding protein [Niallia sp.]